MSDHTYDPKNELEPTTASASGANRLAELGLTQELERNFSLPSLVALCLCLMGTWEAVSAIIVQALQSGGGPVLFYNFIMTFMFSLAIGASLAEIASIYPTAGARGRRISSWATGWISIGAQMMLAASAAFGPAGMIQGLIKLDNMNSYHPERWHAVLIYWALLLYSALINIFGDRILPTVNIVAGTIHVGGFLGITIALAVKSTKRSAEFVFVDLQNASGWNQGVAWLVGITSAVYAFLGYDAAAHLAEELPNAARHVPTAIIGAIVANGFMGLAYVIVILFSMGPLDRVLATPTGQPFIQVYADAANSLGASIMTVLPMISGTMACVAATTSCSRTLWSFARDKGVPFSSYFAHIDKRNKVPTRAIILVTIINALVGLIYIGNPQAYNAFFQMAVMGTYASYLPPIFLMLFKSRQEFSPGDYGPFKLNKLVGVVANAASLVFLVLVIVFSAFPTSMPVTSTNMNYSCVVMGGWSLVGLAYFYIQGNRNFIMPIVQQNTVTIIGMAAPHQFEERGDSDSPVKVE
ncbi:hypothetical protein CERZMDRAFT_40548 [Cercospora zeae-maydis SCOH1-5]|uniref:Amino acid permease/ SLC12A domain-containing protein n=1 Tax=Cercospora zeae-maydis SCOH1-5 TaxID=717836 RepID=A0A6A6FH79_9PEZI|nr:hypothetical protein CERZMDRAFT_40548 [Cercospora zeae-maydis SCOH1-5]